MPHTAKEKIINIDKKDDTLVLLKSPTGSQVWIAGRGASIEELALAPPDGEPQRLVFSQWDAVRSCYGEERQTNPLDYTKEMHRSAAIERRKNPMAGGVPITFLPGRLYGGQGRFLQPGGDYKQFSVANSHPQFGSLLHLGEGKNQDFSVESCLEGDSAKARFRGTVGKNLPGFPQGIFVDVGYELKKNTLTRGTTITNKTGMHILLPSADHGSYMPGKGNVRDLSVLIKTNGGYELDPKTKVATGRLAHRESIFDCHKPVEITRPIEGMYRIAPTDPPSYPLIEIVNRNEGIGLQIGADPLTQVVYGWVPPSENFFSAQPYNGQPTAALHMPAFPEVERMDPIFKQNIETMLPPNQSITYRQVFSAINDFSE